MPLAFRRTRTSPPSVVRDRALGRGAERLCAPARRRGFSDCPPTLCFGNAEDLSRRAFTPPLGSSRGRAEGCLRPEAGAAPRSGCDTGGSARAPPRRAAARSPHRSRPGSAGIECGRRTRSAGRRRRESPPAARSGCAGRRRSSAQRTAAPPCTDGADRRRRCRRCQFQSPGQVEHRDPIGEVPHDAEVVADEDVARSLRGLQVDEQVEDRGLHRYVERGDGSSQTTRRGSPANARAIATRCFSPPDSSLGRAESPRSGSRTCPRSSSARSSAAAPEKARACSGCAGLAEPSGTRLSAESGFWKTIWSAARRPRSVPAAWATSFQVDLDGCRNRLDEAEQRAREGRLAAARFAYETESLTLPEHRRDAGERLDLVAVLVERLRQVADVEERRRRSVE